MVAALALLRVLVLPSESTPTPETFVEQLGIVLSRIAEVEVGDPVPAGPLPGRVEAAVNQTDQRDATVAVWIERGEDVGDGRIEFVLFIVGRREGRLMVEVFRLPAKEGPDLDRTLALKVGEVLDAMLAPEVDEPNPVTWVDPTAGERVERPPPPPPPPSLRWLAELGGRGSAGLDAPESQAGVYLAVGVRRPFGALRGEAILTGGIDSGSNTVGGSGTVVTDEIVTGAGVRLLAPVEPFLVGAQLQAGLRIIQADGVTRLGTEGSETVPLAVLVGSLEGRLQLSDNLEIRTAAGLEYSPDRLTLTVNEIKVVDLGRVRPIAELSVVFLMP